MFPLSKRETNWSRLDILLADLKAILFAPNFTRSLKSRDIIFQPNTEPKVTEIKGLHFHRNTESTPCYLVIANNPFDYFQLWHQSLFYKAQHSGPHVETKFL